MVMKELKEKKVVQELTKEEQVSTFGGSGNIPLKWVMRDGKLVLIAAK